MRQPGLIVGIVLSLAGLAACTGPISTMRSPYHLRTIEVRNTTDKPMTLKIEPTASQHLGAATTFTGLLKPGEVKNLYLYHGFEYEFRILDAAGYTEQTRTTLAVNRDFGLVFGGDSLIPDVRLAASLGEPETRFSDSLQQADPFGLRSSDRIQPDTARGNAMPASAREQIERERRQREGKAKAGNIP